MSIATAVILNVVAVVGLLVLLAATMRLPYHLPTTPRSGDSEPEGARRRRKTAPASSALEATRSRARAGLRAIAPAAIRRRHGQTAMTVSTAIAENRIAK